MTSNSGQWTRDDLPDQPSLSEADIALAVAEDHAARWRRAHGIVEAERDQAREERDKWKARAEKAEAGIRLINQQACEWEAEARTAHHPKPQPYDQGGVRGADSLLRRAECERDAAVARAEQAENARDTAATRAEQLEKALAGSRDAHQRSADAHMEWKARAETAEARTAPAVTRDEIEKAIRETEVLDHRRFAEFAARAVFDLVSGADPAVYVVHESELPHMEDDYLRNFDLSDGRGKYRNATDEEVREAREMAESDLRWLIAVQQHIEAEATPDPVEVKVSTRRPQDYVLVDEGTGSRWRITSDGKWVAEEARDE